MAVKTTNVMNFANVVSDLIVRMMLDVLLVPIAATENVLVDKYVREEEEEEQEQEEEENDEEEEEEKKEEEEE